MKKKRGKKAPTQRFTIDGNNGILFDYRGFFNYIVGGNIEEKILNGMRIDLTDNQIMTYFNIKKGDFQRYVQGIYHNSSNLRFLLSTVPTNITDVSEVKAHIENVLLDIEVEKLKGKSTKDIGKKYGVSGDIINRVIMTLLENEVRKEKDIIEVKDREEQVIDVSDNCEEIEIDNINTMSDFLILLGYTASNFDFNKIDSDILNSKGECDSLQQFIDKYNYKGIESIIFIRHQLLGVYRYSKPFYPAEDIILETLYSKLGKRVVELMLEVIPNYEVRDFTEYVERLKELKRGKVHPKNSFGLLEEEKFILRQVIKKGYPINNRFLPWYTNQEVQNFAKHYGYTDKEPISPIEYTEIEVIDLEPYIEIVRGYKEVKYHDIRWTTDRHNFLKEQYKERGPEVIDEITWCNKAECMLRVKQFSIKQRYTEEETQRIIEVFKEKGFEGLKEEFPNRTEHALRYKIKDLNLIDESNNISLECLKSEVLEELRKEEIEKIRKEETERIRKEELSKVKKELELELRPKIEEKLRKQLDYSIRKELEVVLSEREAKRTEKEIEYIVEELLNSELLKSVNSALTTTLPKDFGTKLVTVLYEDIKLRLGELFKERFK